MLSRPPPHITHRFWADRRGAAAIEFAIVFPVMLVMLFGEVELGQLMVATRRADNAASTVGDIVARLQQMDDTQKTGAFAAATAIMSGAASGPPDLRISEVYVTGAGAKKYVWSEAQGPSLAAHTTCSPLNTRDAAKLAGVILPAGSYVILSEIQYSWRSKLHYVMKTPVNLYYENVLNPRASQVLHGSVSTCPN